MASLLSLPQAAGRINREGLNKDAEMWSFKLQDDPMLTRNPRLNTAQRILEGFLRKNIEINPEWSTTAFQKELNLNDSVLAGKRTILEEETEGAFRTVERDFAVIDDDAVTIVIDEALAEKIRCGQADWRLLQRQSVSIAREKARRYHLENIAPDIYRWQLGYDTFLGYMAGIVTAAGQD
jgi:hypothetical protein